MRIARINGSAAARQAEAAANPAASPTASRATWLYGRRELWSVCEVSEAEGHGAAYYSYSLNTKAATHEGIVMRYEVQ